MFQQYKTTISYPKPSLEAGTQLEGKELFMSPWNFFSRPATLNFLYLETQSSCLCPKKSGFYNFLSIKGIGRSISSVVQ